MGKSTLPAKRALGRGLGALIVNTEIHHPDDAPALSISDRVTADVHAGINGGMNAEVNGGVQQVALDAIYPNPQQPRTRFDENALQELATSIRTHGIIQPLIVTANPTQPGTYWLVAGERRWRAARLAALTEAPALVREASPQQLIELALVENIQRADLSALEEAAAYQSLLHEFGLTHAQMAERVGKSRSAITNTLRLLELPLVVQEALTTQQISAGHARALLPLRDQAVMQKALQQIISQAMNVRQTEALVAQWLAAKPASPAPPKPPQTAAAAQITYLENRFRTALGTKVQLNRNPNGSGRLVVHFYNDDDLEQLYKLMAGSDEAA